MILRSLSKTCLLTVCASLSTLVSAIDSKQPVCGSDFTHEQNTQFVSCFYTGLGLGFSELRPDTKNSAWKLDKKNDVAFKIFGGYQFTQDWFTELAFADLGEAKLKYKNPLNPQKESISYQTIAAFAGYNLPLHFVPETRFFIKAGISYITHSTSDSAVKLDKKNNFVAPALGAGIEWRFADDWTLRGEFESFSNRSRLLSTSVAYWFGNSRYKPVIQPVVIEPEIEEFIEEPQEPTLEELEARNIAALANDQLPEIYVAVDSVELNQAAKNELDALVTALKAFPNAHVEIRGHTDSTGSKAYNQLLSERRAKAVYNYLVEHGIETERLQAVGYGMTMPIADNDSEEGRAQNRRIDFVISKQEVEENAPTHEGDQFF